MQTNLISQLQCRHCGLVFSASGNEHFCCHGCESVFNLLQEKGLGDFYSLQKSAEATCPIPAKISNESYSYIDDSFFIQEFSSDDDRLTFYLEGMNCTACLWLLEKTPEVCKDCLSVQVRMSDSTVRVIRKKGGSFAAIAKTFDRFGYTPHVIKEDKSAIARLQKIENRRDLVRIGIAAGCTGNIMILAVSLYAGASGEIAEQFRWISTALAAPVLIYCAWPFYKSTIHSLRNKHLNIDVPIVAAILAGVGMSIWGLLSGTETLFFDSLSMLVLLLLSSRFLLKRIQQNHLNTSNLATHLLLAQTDRKNTHGQFEKVSSLALQQGDLIRISDSSLICADGFVISGTGLIHTATLTGESLPQTIKEGDFVFAGSQSLGGDWLMQVQSVARESRFSKILEDVRQSSLAKPRISQLADQAAQWFVIIVFTLALAVLIYFASSEPLEGVSRALALVIVTCPCVFGMAIPLSMSLAIRKAAERGIIIKSGDAIEKLTQIKTLFFDKTGTLTQGNLEVIKIEIHPDDYYHLAAATAIERDQTHPVAKAVLKAIKSSGKVRAENVHLLPEGGVSGVVFGRNYKILPSELLSSENGEIKMQYKFYCQDRLIALFHVGDSLRQEASDIITWAKKSGLNPKIISGDRQSVVLNIAQALSLDFSDTISQATPERKSQILKEAGASAAMIGDGANDAAALASAGVGIAVSGSLDVSLKAADIYLTRNSLLDLKTLFKIAGRTKSVMKRNLLFSLSFNLVAGGLAIFGYMTPLWAAVLMPLSSLTVLFSSLHAGRKLTQESDLSWK